MGEALLSPNMKAAQTRPIARPRLSNYKSITHAHTRTHTESGTIKQ